MRATAVNGGASGTALSVSAPSGTVVGDLVIVTCHINANSTIVDNNGTTPFTEDLNDYHPNATAGQTLSVFSRRILAGDPTTFNFTAGASGRWSAIAETWANPHPTVIYDVAPTGGNNRDDTTTNTGTAIGITTQTANAIHCAIMCPDGNGNGVTGIPSGYTSVAQRDTTQAQRIASKVIASPGSTGNQSFTYSTNDAYFAASWAIRDEGPGILSTTRAFYNFGDPFDAAFIRDSSGRGNHLTPYLRINECTIQFRMGRNSATGANAGQQVYGALKGWGKWDRLLTAAEKSALNGKEYWPFSTTTSLQDAKAYYLLDEAADSATYSDSTAGANHLTKTGTTTRVAGPAGTDFAVELTEGDYLTKASPGVELRSSQKAITIAGWVLLNSKPAGAFKQQVFWGQLDNTSGQPTRSGFNVYYDPTADRFCYDQDAGDAALLEQGTFVVENNFGSPATATWYFVLCEYDPVNNQATIAVNNGTRTILSNTIQPVPAAAKIGLGSTFYLNPAGSFSTRTSGWDVADPNGNCHLSHAVNSDLGIGNNSKTVWGWFKVNGTTPYQTLAGFFGSGSGGVTDWIVQISAGLLYWVLGDGANQVYTTVSVPDTNWHLFVAWFDKATNRIYLDFDHGAAKSNAAGPASPPGLSGLDFVVAADSSHVGDNTFYHQYDGMLNIWGIADGNPTHGDLDRLWNNGNGWSLSAQPSPPLNFLWGGLTAGVKH